MFGRVFIAPKQRECKEEIVQELPPEYTREQLEEIICSTNVYKLSGLVQLHKYVAKYAKLTGLRAPRMLSRREMLTPINELRHSKLYLYNSNLKESCGIYNFSISEVSPDIHCSNCDAVVEEDDLVCDMCNTRLVVYVGEKPITTKRKHDNKEFEQHARCIQSYIPPNNIGEVTEFLDRYFAESRPTLLKSRVKQLPLNKDGTRGPTSLNIMREALKAGKFDMLYAQAYSICANYWGWKLVNFEFDKDLILEEYCRVTIAASQLGVSLSISFILLWLLKRRDYAVSANCFHYPLCDETRQKYINNAMSISRLLGWRKFNRNWF